MHKEVLFVLYNAYDYGSRQSREAILNEKVIRLLNRSIVENKNGEILKVSLDFIRMIFEDLREEEDPLVYKRLKREFEALNITVTLENLQLHNSDEISQRAELILMDHWNLEDLYLLNNRENII